jgi:phage tail sheath protein FI
MPITPTYPGVYIEEVPSGVHTITGVATSVTAFIGRAERGPVNESTTINSFADFERNFGSLTLLSTLGFAVRDFYLNGGSQAIIVRLDNGGSAATITLPATASPPSPNLILEAASVGSWGANLAALVDYNTKDKANTKLFNLTIQELDPTTKAARNSEKFLNVSVDDKDPRFLPKVLELSSSLGRVQKSGGGGYNVSTSRPNVVPNIGSPPHPNPIAAIGGSDGSALTKANFFGAGMQAAKQGVFALEKADLFNLLCIPPYTTANDVDTDLLAAAVAYCRTRRAMMIVDSKSTWTKKETAIKEFSDGTYPGITGPDRTYSALFFPRLKQPNPLRDSQIEEFVSCGAVAGVFSRTDASRGVWKAPAGIDAGLVGVPELSVSLTDDENGELNPLGVNCLRAFPVYGRLVWGSRTQDGADRLASEWKYIPVRRTALFIEESLYRGTKWVVFEPNDEPLWAQIRLNVGAFMQNLFRQGAFQGKTPREAYLVKCDKETTTQNDINLGIVNIVVGFAPLKPAEFVIIKISQLAGQIAT